MRDREIPLLLRAGEIAKRVILAFGLVGFGIAYLIIGGTAGRAVGGALTLIGVALLAPLIRRFFAKPS